MYVIWNYCIFYINNYDYERSEEGWVFHAVAIAKRINPKRFLKIL